MREARAVYGLSLMHAEGVRALCEAPDLATLLGLDASPSREQVVALIQRRLQERTAGTAYDFVCTQGETVLGYGGLLDAASDAARVVVGIDAHHRRQGHGSFTMQRVLELAFENLRRDRVVARGGDEAASAFLTRLGFGQAGGEFVLTRRQWEEARHRPALDALHPSLRPILAAELAAGNEIAESRMDWPAPQSVFIRLRREFLAKLGELPAGVQFTRLDDPHWWAAEYSAGNPRHTIASC